MLTIRFALTLAASIIATPAMALLWITLYTVLMHFNIETEAFRMDTRVGQTFIMYLLPCVVSVFCSALLTMALWTTGGPTYPRLGLILPSVGVAFLCACMLIMGHLSELLHGGDPANQAVRSIIATIVGFGIVFPMSKSLPRRRRVVIPAAPPKVAHTPLSTSQL